jgi:hypothetical protein
MEKKSEVEKLMESFSSQLEKSFEPKNSGHDNVSVEEKKEPKSIEKNNAVEGFSEKQIIDAEMWFKFDKITKENFEVKIIDLQNFLVITLKN